MEETLNLVFDEISFEMGFNGEKHELILTPEGDKVNLFELVYFRKHAPKGGAGALEHSGGTSALPEHRSAHRRRLGHIWGGCADLAGGAGRKQFRHLRLLQSCCLCSGSRRAGAWWMLTTLTDQVLGEIPT